VRVWAAVCVLLTAALANASEVRIAVPGATGAESSTVTRLGNWEVAVSFDPVLCEISCVYRLRADRFGRMPVADLLLPPAIDLRVFFGERPTTLTIDPAHTRDPRIGARDVPFEGLAALPACQGPPNPPPPVTPITPVAAPRPSEPPAAPRSVSLPLRV
jgi:hypothetical protein